MTKHNIYRDLPRRELGKADALFGFYFPGLGFDGGIGLGRLAME